MVNHFNSPTASDAAYTIDVTGDDCSVTQTTPTVATCMILRLLKIAT